MGGVIAQDGFDYQIWDGLARLPGWLLNPAFEGMIFEGLEDLEARFFAPLSPNGAIIDRYQAKSGALKPAEIKDIVDGFAHYNSSYPSTARSHILVTPQIPASLAYLAKDRDRVRKARPFYDPFLDIQARFDARFRADVLATYPDPLGSFFIEFVDFEESNIPDETTARSLFNNAFHATFPSSDFRTSQLRRAFDDLLAMAKSNVGSLLTRRSLIEIIEKAVGEPLHLNGFGLHIRSDRNESDPEMLEFDASAYSAGAGSKADWVAGLLAPLQKTAAWLKGQGAARLRLQGSYRLSVAFALGWCFRSATGIDLDIVTRDGVWSTDTRPDFAKSYAQWEISDAMISAGDVLTVSVGILRDPTGDVVGAGVPIEKIQRFHLSSPVRSAEELQAIVGPVKSRLSELASKYGLQGIRLYYAGPSQFAVALGHRWNAMPQTILHEFDSENRTYVQTLTLP